MKTAAAPYPDMDDPRVFDAAYSALGRLAPELQPHAATGITLYELSVRADGVATQSGPATRPGSPTQAWPMHAREAANFIFGCRRPRPGTVAVLVSAARADRPQPACALMLLPRRAPRRAP